MGSVLFPGTLFVPFPWQRGMQGGGVPCPAGSREQGCHVGAGQVCSEGQLLLRNTCTSPSMEISPCFPRLKAFPSITLTPQITHFQGHLLGIPMPQPCV